MLRDVSRSKIITAELLTQRLFVRARVEGTFSIADKHLSTRPFVLSEEPTIVDFSMANYIVLSRGETGLDIAKAYPAIAWRRQVAALPGWTPPYELMAVGVPFRCGVRHGRSPPASAHEILIN